MSIPGRAHRARLAFRGGGHFGTRVALTASTNIALGVLGVTTGSIAARILGPSGRGELAAIQLWAHVLMVVASLGLPEALVYFSARKRGEAGRYIASGTALALTSSVVFCVLGYLLMPFLLSAQTEQVIGAARWYLVAVPIALYASTPQHALRGLGDFLPWNVLRVTPNVGWLLVLVTFWAWGSPRPSLLAAGYVGVLAMLIIPFHLVTARKVKGPFRPSTKDWGPMLRYGLPSAASRVPYVVNFRLDQIALASLFSPAILGLYTVAVSWGTLAQPILTPLGTALLPEIASKKNPEAQARVFAQGARAAVTLSLILSVVIMLITPIGLSLLFGGSFASAVPIALLLVPVGALVGLNLVLAEGLLGLGRPKLVMAADLAGICVTGLSLILLLGPLGMMGAAISSLAGQSAVTTALFGVATHATRGKVLDFLRPDPVLLAKGVRSVLTGHAWPVTEDSQSHGG